ncbi:MAG TPA: filamentous hemagglutinin N-terminal domain-containing protein, partial [Burkholderiales bacterium]|nr:filamentous hemagglutinin N-terminal domain-containing protein [Burkholderiales bacterium]
MQKEKPRRRPRATRCFVPSQLALAVGLALGVAPPVILANPTGPVVVHGQAQFAAQGNRLTVTNSPNAIINWQGFSIGREELTRFQQQNAASAVLNRVIGIDPSSILGTLSSNGRVFLINPNGIIFGAGSVIDTQGFLASTLNIADRDFLEGRLRFEGAGGAIRNYGAISGGAGDVFLIAPSITNAGAITSQGGRVVLAAGQKVEIGTTGLEGIRFEVQAPTDEALNLGRLEGGAVGMFAGSLKHSGDIRASTLAREGGRIVLKAAGDAIVDGGSLAASGSRGGDVQVLGHRVGLTGAASLDASGEQGGGTVLVGGDFQGGNPEVPNAARTHVGPDTVIRADATRSGDGGKVIVWSDEVTRAYGRVSARGGPEGGDGGFVEISGRGHLDFAGRVDTSAPAGRAGTLLLDPTDVVVVDDPDGTQQNLGGGGFTFDGTTAPINIFADASATSTLSWQTIDDLLLAGDGSGGFSNVIITTSGSAGQPGNITLRDGYTLGLAGSGLGGLLFYAHNDITVNGTVSRPLGGGFALRAGWGGDIFNGDVTPGTGNILINSGGGFVGSLDARAGNAITVFGTVDGDYLLEARGGITISNPGSFALRSAGGPGTLINLSQDGSRNVLLQGVIAGGVSIDTNGRIVIDQPVPRTTFDASGAAVTLASAGIDVLHGAEAGTADVRADSLSLNVSGPVGVPDAFGSLAAPLRMQIANLQVSSNGQNASVLLSGGEEAPAPLNILGASIVESFVNLTNRGDITVSGAITSGGFSGLELHSSSDTAGGQIHVTAGGSIATGFLALEADQLQLDAPVSAAGLMTINPKNSFFSFTRGINLGTEDPSRLSLTADEFGRLSAGELQLFGADVLVTAPLSSSTIGILQLGLNTVVDAPLALTRPDSMLYFSSNTVDINAPVQAGSKGVLLGRNTGVSVFDGTSTVRPTYLVGVPEADPKPVTGGLVLKDSELARISTTGTLFIGDIYNASNPQNAVRFVGPVNLNPSGISQLRVTGGT